MRVWLNMALSTARGRGDGNKLVTSIRRKNIDHWFDRRAGSRIYDYGLDSPAYSNAATNPQGLTAHYYIWGGGAQTDDEIQEYRGDVEWNPGGGDLTVAAGPMAESRSKPLHGFEMPFGPIGRASCRERVCQYV